MPEWYKKRILQRPRHETQSITERPSEFYQLELPDFKIPTVTNSEDSVMTGLENRKWRDIWEHKGKASGINNTDASLQQEHPSLFLLPFAPEVMGSGLGLGVLKTLGGYAGSYVGSKIGNEVGYALDNTFNKQLFEPLGEIVGGFSGFGKGYNLFEKAGMQGALKYLSNTGKEIPRWFMRPELRTNIGRINQRTFFAEDQTPKYNSNQLPGLNKRSYQSPSTSQLEIVPQAAYASEVPIEKFESLVREMPTVNGKANTELWEAAGVDMSRFPKTLSEDLRKMQIDRLNKAASGKFNGIVNLANKNRIVSYFNSNRNDKRIGYIDVENIGNDAGVRWIQSFIKGLGLGPYTPIGMDAARKYVSLEGRGLISGRELLEPKKTVPYISAYFNTSPVKQAKLSNGTETFVPIPGKYHETDLREAIIRQWMQNNLGKTPSERELNFLFSKANEGGMTALEDGYLNVSSFPEYFDETGHFRSDLPQDLVDELSIYLNEGTPGFYERYIGSLKSPLSVPNKLITPFIHPSIYLDPHSEHPNLGIFSTFKLGGKIKKQE